MQDEGGSQVPVPRAGYTAQHRRGRDGAEEQKREWSFGWKNLKLVTFSCWWKIFWKQGLISVCLSLAQEDW